MYCVDELWRQHGTRLGLVMVAGSEWLRRPICAPEAQRPGLSLSGFLKGYAPNRILVFGQAEIEYLRDLDPSLRIGRLDAILTDDTPAVIVTRNFRPPQELAKIVASKQIPMFRTPMSTSNLLNKLTVLLAEAFAPSVNCHGTLVEVFGVGVLIQGASSVGKSEAALGLIERGHRLVSDDVVRVRKREGGYLEGFGAQLTRHLMEIRGIGIINVAHLYGAVCVRESKSVDIVVQLEVWNDKQHYDRVGIEERYINIMSVPVPFHLLPVKPGRDVVLLLETIALNHRLKQMGLHSAREFRQQQVAAIEKKSEKKRETREKSAGKK